VGFTYAEAEPFNWLRDHFQLKRNDYDRVAHFMGLVGAILTLAIFSRWHDRELRA
jgi:putative membrane protein